jgi:hypothetical protein
MSMTIAATQTAEVKYNYYIPIPVSNTSFTVRIAFHSIKSVTKAFLAVLPIITICLLRKRGWGKETGIVNKN